MTRIIPLLVLLMAIASCSSKPAGGTEVERAEPLTEEQARQLGAAAAHAIATSDHDDTLDLQRCIVDAHATRSQMVLDGNDDATAAFDQALRDELRRSDPSLADELFP